MVIDTSAVIAILLGEQSSEQLIAALDTAPSRKISAASVVEASLVLLARYGEVGDVWSSPENVDRWFTLPS